MTSYKTASERAKNSSPHTCFSMLRHALCARYRTAVLWWTYIPTEDAVHVIRHQRRRGRLWYNTYSPKQIKKQTSDSLKRLRGPFRRTNERTDACVFPRAPKQSHATKRAHAGMRMNMCYTCTAVRVDNRLPGFVCIILVHYVQSMRIRTSMYCYCII